MVVVGGVVVVLVVVVVITSDRNKNMTMSQSLCGHLPTHNAIFRPDNESNLSRVMRKPTFCFLTRSDTNQAIQPQKMA